VSVSVTKETDYHIPADAAIDVEQATDVKKVPLMATDILKPDKLRQERQPRRRWKILEVFTWTMAITTVANRGWEGCSPISLETGFNLYNRADRKRAWAQYVADDPDAAVCAFPCRLWSLMQNLNMKREGYPELLAKLQQKELALLRFAARIAARQRARGKLFLAENAIGSRAFQQQELEDMINNTLRVHLHLCARGLQHPENGLPIRKGTRLQMSPEMDPWRLQRRCPGHSRHAIIQGTVKVQDKTEKQKGFCRMGLAE